VIHATTKQLNPTIDQRVSAILRLRAANGWPNGVTTSAPSCRGN
jgi:hypothetical protein